MIKLSDNFILNCFISSIGVMMIFFPPLFTGSCGGSDTCGDKWCLIGIIDKYYSIIFISGVMFILYGIINVIIGIL